MFCGQCGKKVHDNMLFCPFCGTAIVVPDQDDEVIGASNEKTVTEPKSDSGRSIETPEMSRTKNEAKRPALRSLFDEIDDPEDFEDEKEAFVPLIPDKESSSKSVDLRKTVIADDFEDEYDDDFDDGMPNDEYDSDDEPDDYDAYDDADEDEDDVPPEPPRRTVSRFAPKPSQHRRSTGTYIPVRDTRPEDMFLGTEEEDDYDRDDYDSDDFDDDYEFEENEKRKPFLIRHIRSVIGIILLLAVLAGCAIYAILPAGQQTLARINLAWTADAYAAVGRADYDKGNYSEAASYYLRAMEKDKTNYEYAHSALVCYYEAGNIEEAKNMAIKCIELRPDSAEPYRELMSIYGNSELPPLVKDYIQEGYRRTGDEYLNLGNWNIQVN